MSTFAPQLEGNKCSVLIVKLATGHILKKDLTIFLSGENEEEIFQVFESFTYAEEFVHDLIKKMPEFECLIYDHNGDHIASFDIYKVNPAFQISDPEVSKKKFHFFEKWNFWK